MRVLDEGEGVKTVILCDLHTHMCVRHTAADAFFRGYGIVVASDGVETTLLSILQAMLIHGMIVQGRSDEKHYGVAAVGSPEKNALRAL